MNEELELCADKQKISVVVPVFNEDQNVITFYERISGVLDSIGFMWEIIFVNDGSSDRTLELLLDIQTRDQRVKIIDFSRNFGKEMALSAGIRYASGNILVTIDADLQHPPETIPEMVKKWQEGYDVVFGTRRSRQIEPLLRRMSTKLYYITMRFLTNIRNLSKLGDFCLFDKKVVKVLKDLPEHNRFMKGLFAWVGFKQAFVIYDLHPRHAGRTKWSFWSLWNFALEGITSFSTIPLRVWTYIGLFVAISAIVYGAFVVIDTLIFGADVPGYPTLVVSVLFMNGLLLINLGILGEYISRIFIEVKGRPLYVVNRLYGFDSLSNNKAISETFRHNDLKKIQN